MENKKLKETEEKINLAVEDLFGELKKGKSDRLLKYLEFCSKFYRYSFSNTILIWFQKPDARHVAGFHKWSELGFKINKGEKGITILAPREYKYFIEDTGKWVFLNKEMIEILPGNIEIRTGIRFIPVTVFDKAQVTNIGGKDLVDDYFYNIGNNFEQKYENIKNLIVGTGIIVEEVKDINAEGISLKGTIEIKETRDSNNKLLTLIHEWAHEILHQKNDRKDLTRGQIELQAEVVSYVVCYWLGLKNPFTADYVQNWGNDGKELKKNLEIIVSTSNAMINKISKIKN